MTASAIGAEFSVVNVVCSMAATAGDAQKLHLIQRAAMAITAIDCRVRSGKWEVCLRVMVERPGIPRNGVVAGIAAFVKAPSVRIVFLVAIPAVRVNVPEGAILVAVGTLVVGVLSKQWKGSQIMIEKDRVLPVDFRMTIFALCTQRTVVSIVVEVARTAISLQRYLKYWFNMTVGTNNVTVSTTKCIFGVFVMFECRRRPVVVAVTIIAFEAVVSVMAIVFGMAGNARGVHLIVERVF